MQLLRGISKNSFLLQTSELVKSLLGILLICSLAACGGGGGGGAFYDGASMLHSVPSWIIGTYKAVRLEFGTDVSSLGMTLIIDADHFEYHYPDCDVYGVISMDTGAPWYTSNQYTMEMTSATSCGTFWDIPAAPGTIDTGRMWSEDLGFDIIRISDYHAESFWIYHNVNAVATGRQRERPWPSVDYLPY